MTARLPVRTQMSPVVRAGPVFSAALQAVTPDGTYHAFLRLQIAEELSQTSLASYPGASWADPQHSQLRGSPLEYVFAKVRHRPHHPMRARSAP